MMKQPSSTQSQDFLEILLKLQADAISPQDAMAQLVPYLLECKTEEQAAILEPVKESIIARMKYQLSNDSHPFD